MTAMPLEALRQKYVLAMSHKHPHAEVPALDDEFMETVQATREQVVNDIAGFLDTVYQGKAADLIRAKARAGRFVNGTP